MLRWASLDEPSTPSSFTGPPLRPAASSASGLPSLLDITLADVAAGLGSGQFIVLNLATSYLKRIEEVDGHFRSILETNPTPRPLPAR